MNAQTAHDDVRHDDGEVFQSSRDLKTGPGGELYSSDVFSDRRIPAGLRSDPLLLGERRSGALYGEDFRRMLQPVGCNDARSVCQAPIPLLDPRIEANSGMVGFREITMHAFKLPLEDRCEDYGQVATYLGTIAGLPGDTRVHIGLFERAAAPEGALQSASGCC